VRSRDPPPAGVGGMTHHVPAGTPPRRAPRMPDDGRLPPHLADWFYLIAHDGRGRPLVHARVLALGVTGAVLGELLLAGAATLTQGCLWPVPGGPAPEAVTAAVLAKVATERPTPVRDWLHYLASPSGADTVERVSARLGRAGLLTRAQQGLRRRTVWVPADPLAALWPGTYLAGQARQRAPLTLPVALLAAVVAVCGLTRCLPTDGDRGALDHLLAPIPLLPEPERLLLAELEAAVAVAATGHRR
jgi:hypothetical protein